MLVINQTHVCACKASTLPTVLLKFKKKNCQGTWGPPEAHPRLSCNPVTLFQRTGEQLPVQGRGHRYWTKWVAGHKTDTGRVSICLAGGAQRKCTVPPPCNRPGAEVSGGGWSVLRSKRRPEANYPHWGWSS